MIVEVWDLLGSEAFARTVVSGREDRVDGATLRHLRHVLVYPKDDGSNRAPHLLDPERPDVADLLDPNGDIAPDIRERTWLMRELLLPEDLNASPFWQTPPDRRIFRDWFDYQRGVLDEAGGERRSPDQTILAVPDFLGIKAQEALLSDSGFDRIRTRLLWRPIAAALGAEDMLEESGVSPGDRVAVLDVSPDGAYFDLCILKMVPPKDEDWSGASSWQHLVPCRATAPEMPRTVQDNGFFFCSPAKGGKLGENRIRFDLAMSFSGTFLLPRGGTWIEQDSSILPFSPSLRNVESNELRQKISEILASCKIALSVGAPFRKEAPFPAGVPLIREPEGRNWILRGCVRFADRNTHGLPTYYDEVRGLYAIGQNTHDEIIVAATLIPHKEEWPGGKSLAGAPYRAEIEAGTGSSERKPHADFRFRYGLLTRNSPLKFYRHEFDIQLQSNHEIVLQPSIIPGQGLARVEVCGLPSAQNGKIFLKLEEMEDETRQDGLFRTFVTMDVLESEMDRSFPPDIPHVLPDVDKWNAVESQIHAYLDGRAIDSGAFAQAGAADDKLFRNDKFSVVMSMQRTNVFGSDPTNQSPSNASPALIKQLIWKLQSDWQWYQTHQHPKGTHKPAVSEDDLIRLIAWTYMADDFGTVVDTVLQKGLDMADNGAPGLLLQEYTLLANLVRTERRQRRFMEAFSRQWQRYRQNPDVPFRHWIRAASYILMFNNDATAHLQSRTCRNMMKDFYITLGRFNDEIPAPAVGVATQWHKHLFRAMLFLLKRRRLDSKFIPKDDSADWLHKDLAHRLSDTIAKYGSRSAIGQQARAVSQYLQGRGTLEGATIFNE